jgi:hypothetical protein
MLFVCVCVSVGSEARKLLRLYEPFVLFIRPMFQTNLIKVELKAENSNSLYLLNGLDQLYMYY